LTAPLGKRAAKGSAAAHFRCSTCGQAISVLSDQGQVQARQCKVDLTLHVRNGSDPTLPTHLQIRFSSRRPPPSSSLPTRCRLGSRCRRHSYALSLAPSLAPSSLSLHCLVVSIHTFRLALTSSLSFTPSVCWRHCLFLFASLSRLRIRGLVLPMPLPCYESQ